MFTGTFLLRVSACCNCHSLTPSTTTNYILSLLAKMAQPFRFGFSNDDIEDDNDHDDLMDIEKPLATNGPAEHVELKLVQPKRHTLQELVRIFSL